MGGQARRRSGTALSAAIAAVSACLVLTATAAAATTRINGSTMAIDVGNDGSLNASINGRSSKVFTSEDGAVAAGNAGLIISFGYSQMNSGLYPVIGLAYGFRTDQTQFSPGPGTPTVSGNGTQASPFRVVSVFTVNASPGVTDLLRKEGTAQRGRSAMTLAPGIGPPQLEITQTTTHVSGTSEFQTTWAIRNTSGVPRVFRAFAAGQFNFGSGNIPTGTFIAGPPPVLQSATANNSGLVASLQGDPAHPWDRVQAGSAADVLRNSVDPAGSGYSNNVHDVEALDGDTALGVEWNAHADNEYALASGATQTIGATWRFTAPVVGRTLAAQPAGGRVMVRKPGRRRAEQLRAGDSLPSGSIVDTRAGAMNIQAAGGAPGKPQYAQLRYGVFRVAQGRRSGATELRLTGSLQGCPRRASARSAQAAARRRTGRRLWGRGKGRFRTVGRRGSGSVRGTTWQVTDRCDGSTVIQSIVGTVAATDVGRRRFVRLLRSGRSYVAAPPRRGRRR